MNTDILTEARNFKTLLKENYAIALGSLLKKVKRGIEHNVDSSLCIHWTFLNLIAVSVNYLQIK